jgi:hypothetical protein
MTHSRKRYWKTTWIGGQEFDVYRVGNKVVAYQNNKKVKEWKNDISFRMFEISHMDEAQMGGGGEEEGSIVSF